MTDQPWMVDDGTGRRAITIDLSEAYCRLATDQTLARQRAGKVLGRVHLERQGTLFAPVLEEG